ncbi:ammonium transporter, partial [Haematococcus lacustris]
GLLYGGHGQLLLCQIIAVLVVIAWVCFWSGLFFWGMKKAGLLRIPLEDEAVGMDAATMATDQAEVTRAHYTKVGNDASVKRATGTVLLANASDQAARGVSMPQPFEVAAERSDGLALSSAAVWADMESGRVAPTSLEQQDIQE